MWKELALVLGILSFTVSEAADHDGTIDADYDFGKYHRYGEIIQLLKDLSSKYSVIAELQDIGTSYEGRFIYNMKISSGDSSSKPAIIMECGIHGREWISVSAGAYIVNKLLTSYGSDFEITALVDEYEINVIVVANPDGYKYSWNKDRVWRKTRSRSIYNVSPYCMGADANRNFDIQHCGIGTSKNPCEDIYCGDKPFSEKEAQALRDMMLEKEDRLKVYFAIRAYAQSWLTPYGYTKSFPPNYDELIRVGKAGVDALAKRYGTKFKLGALSNITYPIAGTSMDFAYEKVGVKMAFTVALRYYRDGLFLPKKLILPVCEETWDGIKGAIEAL